MKRFMQHLAAAIVLVCTSGAAPAVQRAFVSAIAGSESNQISGCPATEPCRTFGTAVAVVDAGGEVVAMDSGAYGAVTLSSSVSLIAAPGVYAGITAFPGANGVTVTAPGIRVSLRGLSINGMGGSHGVLLTQGATLTLENCRISDFSLPGSAAVHLGGNASLRIVDSLLRDNDRGISLTDGAAADLLNTRLLGNQYGVFVSASGTSSTVQISDSHLTGNAAAGIYAQALSAPVQLDLARSTIASGGHGIRLAGNGSGALATAILSDNVIVNNSGWGIYNESGSVVRSLQNNTVQANSGGANFAPLTPVALQ